MAEGGNTATDVFADMPCGRKSRSALQKHYRRSLKVDDWRNYTRFHVVLLFHGSSDHWQMDLLGDNLLHVQRPFIAVWWV